MNFYSFATFPFHLLDKSTRDIYKIIYTIRFTIRYDRARNSHEEYFFKESVDTYNFVYSSSAGSVFGYHDK